MASDVLCVRALSGFVTGVNFWNKVRVTTRFKKKVYLNFPAGPPLGALYVTLGDRPTGWVSCGLWMKTLIHINLA